MPKTVIALLDDTDEARKAVEELLHNGFRKNDLGRALQILRGHGPMRAAEVYRLVLHMRVTA